jgi:hypothetical protein
MTATIDKPLDLRSWADKELDRDVEHAELELLEELRTKAVKAEATLRVFRLLKSHIERTRGVLPEVEG